MSNITDKVSLNPKEWLHAWGLVFANTVRGLAEMFHNGRLWIGITTSVLLHGSIVLLLTIGAFSVKKADETMNGLLSISYDESMPPKAFQVGQLAALTQEIPIPPELPKVNLETQAEVNLGLEKGTTNVTGEVLRLNPNATLTTEQILALDTVSTSQKTAYLIPGQGTINLTLENVKFVPREARYPTIVGKMPVDYPDYLRERGIEGRVLPVVGLDSTGKVFDAAVAKSSGYAVLDNLALNGVRKTTFTPAMQGEKAVAVKLYLPVEFALE